MVSYRLEAEAGRRRESFPMFLAQLCYSSSNEKNVYRWGQGPRHMFTGSLRWAIVAKVQTVHAEATLKIISERAPGAKAAQFNQIHKTYTQKDI